MNKKKLLSLLLLFFSIGSIAQSADQPGPMKVDEERFFRAGLKIGTNINKLPGLSYGKGFAYNYQLGGFLQFNFSNRFGVQPEFNWIQSHGEKTTEVSTIYDDIFGGGSQKNSWLNYLEIPVLLNINMGQSKHVKLQIGPSYGFLLNNKSDTTSDIFKLYPKNEFGAAAGFWLQLPFAYLGGRYKYGFTNHSNKIGERWHNQGIQIFIGVTI